MPSSTSKTKNQWRNEQNLPRFWDRHLPFLHNLVLWHVGTRGWTPWQRRLFLPPRRGGTAVAFRHRQMLVQILSWLSDVRSKKLCELWGAQWHQTHTIFVDQVFTISMLYSWLDRTDLQRKTRQKLLRMDLIYNGKSFEKMTPKLTPCAYYYSM